MSESPFAPQSPVSPLKEVVFHCEYAPSGRAKCRVCLNSIFKNSLRLAVSLPLAEPSLPEPQDEKVTKQRRIAAEAPQWCHANCFRRFRASRKWWREHVHPAVRWIGFHELNSSDKAQVRRFVAACAKGDEPAPFRSDEKPQTETGATVTKDARHENKTKIGDGRVARGDERKGSRSRTEEKSRLERKEKLRDDLADQYEKGGTFSGKEEGSKVARRGAKRGTGGDDEVERKRTQGFVKPEQGRTMRATNKGAGKLRRTKAEDVELARAEPGEESIGLALTAHQQQDIEKQLEKAEKESVASLRSLLRTNKQKITGAKEELAHRVAECRVLGAIPKCPQCHEGFLRFDGNKGEYRCPGYVNEEGEYERCLFRSADVKRLRWNESSLSS